MSEWLTAWVCKDLCMLLNLELQWECCQWLSCLLFQVARYVILDPSLDKRWTHSCFAVLNCSSDQRRCVDMGWIFLFLLLKIGCPVGWAASQVLRSTISTFPVNFDLAFWNFLEAIWCSTYLHICKEDPKYLGNCKKQKKGTSLHCNINKLLCFQHALRQEAFTNVRIFFKIVCNFTIDNLRSSSEHKYN